MSNFKALFLQPNLILHQDEKTILNRINFLF